MTENLCKGCPINYECCRQFIPAGVFSSSQKSERIIREITAAYPYIRGSGKYLRVEDEEGVRHVEYLTCERHDPVTGNCRDYHTLPRPRFCHITGPEHPFDPTCDLHLNPHKRSRRKVLLDWFRR